MDILHVTKGTYEGGIEFADLNTVKSALKIFANGGTPAARETTQHGFEGDPAGGIGLMLKTMIDGKYESAFMKELLQKVDGVTEDRGFSRHYDYDGVGPFFKTTVGVTKIKLARRKFVYLLELNAAYVGDTPCAGLAESLGANRALWRDEVSVELAPVGGRFEVDFNDIAERLANIGLVSFTGNGEDMANHIMSEVQLPDRGKPSIRVRNDDLSVDFGILSYSVARPIDYRSGKVMWSKEGAVISGPVSEFHDDSNPRLYVTIEVPRVPGEESWDRKPVLDPALKQAIHDQADAIMAAFM
jgi:hypothetical protein